MPDLVFVMARKQNHFFIELVAALRHELDGLGVTSFVSFDGFPPPRDGLVYLLVPPHEYFHFVRKGEYGEPDDGLLARTIFLCAEQPGTGFFESNVELSRRAGSVFDINPASAHELRRRGLLAHHLQLGYSGYWDRFANDAARDVDVLFLGCSSARRERYLASYSPVLAHRRTRIILSDNSHPNHSPAANFLIGDEKLATLGRSRVLLNLHQSNEPYFEWLRLLEAMHAGCAVVSEHSTWYRPLVAGVHFIAGRPESLGLLADDLLDDDGMLTRVRASAYELIRGELPLRRAVEELAEVAAGIDAATAPVGRAMPTLSPPLEVVAPEAQPATLSTTDVVLTAMKDVRLDLMELRRDLTRMRTEAVSGPQPRVRVAWTSPAYAGACPRVTVITALYNHASWITAALDSVARSTFEAFELVVVDDGSTDRSLHTVTQWAAAHPEIAMLVLTHPINRGLPHARNSGLDFARGDYVFVLDADNDVFPGCISRLVAALDADSQAAFAYGMLACFDDRGYLRLVSHWPWEPERLRLGNYIDAMALLRADTLRKLGGYTTDRRLYGWEDYDLYCRLAETGRRGIFVQEMVARYRVSATSMLSLTNLSQVAAFAALREHSPRLFGDAGPRPLTRANERSASLMGERPT